MQPDQTDVTIDLRPRDRKPRAPGDKPVRVMPPPGACDCHAHVFDGRSALVADRLYDPAEAPLGDYVAVLAHLGLSRGVIVQPSVYGTDNRATLAAAACDPERFRAVVVVDETIDEPTLRAYDEQGARGVRLNAVFGATLDGLSTVARRLTPLGWHVQVLIDVSAFAGLAELARDLPVPLVVDHMGHISTTRTTDDPGFQALLRAVGEGHAWVKLSGGYRMTTRQRAPYDDVTPFARALVAANPDRCLWASDWPHPGISAEMPEDAMLLDVLADWAPDADTQRRILVENPARLYRFSAS